MSSSTRTIIIFGSGPGIGTHVAAEFASKGFNHIILLARNQSRLQEDKAFVAKANSNVEIDTLTVDLSDLSSIPAVLKQIDELASEIEVVFFNAARIRVSEPLQTPVEEIEEDFKISNLALYIVAQWAVPKLQSLAKSNPSAKPSLLVTSSHLPWSPIPVLLSLSLTKASQANMVESLSLAFKESGVHIGLVHAEGTVAPENKRLTPANIATETFGFYESGEGLHLHIKE